MTRDPSKLSRDPAQIRNRLRHSNKQHERDVAMLASHRKPIEEWDLEELAQGKPRCKDGSFKGPRPKWITPAVVRESKRRLQLAAFDELSSHVKSAIQVLVNLMTSDEMDDSGRPLVDGRTKLMAAKLVLEHVIGKPKVRVEVDSTDGLRNMLASALILPGGKPAHPVIDGQFTEEDDADRE